MEKTFFIRLLALCGVAACGFVMAAAYGAYRHHQAVDARLTQWCAAQPGCMRVRFESSVKAPLVKVQMKPARQGQKADDLLASMRRSGVFEMDDGLKRIVVKMPEPQVRVIVSAA